jgi:hypothetical protein
MWVVAKVTETSNTDSNLSLYCELWQAIIVGFQRQRKSLGIPIQTQAEIAIKAKTDDAAVSRIIHGDGLLKNSALLMRVARAYGATDPQIRALITLASAAAAEKDEDPELAALYRGMFEPLFTADRFAAEINLPANIVFHSLIDVGVSTPIAEKIGNQVEATETEAAAIGAVILALNGCNDPAAQNAVRRLPDLLERAKTFGQIVPINPDVPWAGRLGRRVLKQSENQGIRHATWARIPNVLLTRISLKKGEKVSDRRHGGIEFLFLAAGSGVFEMVTVGSVELREDIRPLVAYRPQHSHHFTATADQTRIWVVSYLKADESKRDAIHEVLFAARRSAGATGRRGQSGESL